MLTGRSLSAATLQCVQVVGMLAAGVIGGLAAGTIIGAAVAGPRHYAPPPHSAAGICRAGLRLDGRGAGMGRRPGCVDVSGRQSLRVNRSDHSRYAPHRRHEPFPRTMRS